MLFFGRQWPHLMIIHFTDLHKAVRILPSLLNCAGELLPDSSITTRLLRHGGLLSLKQAPIYLLQKKPHQVTQYSC